MESGHLSMPFWGIGRERGSRRPTGSRTTSPTSPAPCSTIARGRGAQLAAAILARFWSLYQHMDDPKLHDEHRRCCFLLGQRRSCARGFGACAPAPSISRPTSLVIERLTNPAAASPLRRGDHRPASPPILSASLCFT